MTELAGGQPMAVGMDSDRLDEIDRAVDRLGRMVATRPICEEERQQLEAARDCLATYAIAARDLADAGVATPRLMALIERGWREALSAFNRAEEERAARRLTAAG
jgi:hypothetical protein